VTRRSACELWSGRTDHVEPDAGVTVACRSAAELWSARTFHVDPAAGVAVICKSAALDWSGHIPRRSRHVTVA
jgi:hypothetical protein